MSRSIVIVILVIILIAIPILMRKLSWKKMINALNDVDYNRYYDIIDSFSCKMTFSAFDRENMRLSGFIAQNRKDDVENQIKMMMNMRIKPKQKVALGTRGFYYYLEQEKTKRARDMIDFAKAIIGQDEDKIKAGQKTFMRRLIAAVVVFLIVTIVQLAINLAASVGGQGNDAESAWSCASSLINGQSS